MAYYNSGNRSSGATTAILPLVSDLEEKMGELKKENEEIEEQMTGLKNSVNQLKKEKILLIFH